MKAQILTQINLSNKARKYKNKLQKLTEFIKIEHER